LLALAVENQKRIPDGLITHDIKSEDIIVVDWIHSENELSKNISGKSNLKWPDATTITKQLRDYCQRQSIKEEWKKSVHEFCGGPQKLDNVLSSHLEFKIGEQHGKEKENVQSGVQG
jgi:hypothetical protein